MTEDLAEARQISGRQDFCDASGLVRVPELSCVEFLL
jgi:hypothetical protein